MVTKKKYSFSFTGASALLAETLIVAEEYVRLQDWEKVKVWAKKYYQESF